MSEIWNLSTICRCCHTDGNFKSLREPYGVGQNIEIYEAMLRDIFAIAIFQTTTATFEASYTICEDCILKLRAAARFRRQVLECEQKFYIYCKNEQFPLAAAVVKVEEPTNPMSYEDDNNIEDIKGSVNLKNDCKIEIDIEMPSDDINSFDDNNDGQLWDEVKVEREIKPKLTKKVTSNLNVTDKATNKVTNVKTENDKLEKGYKLIPLIRNIGKASPYACSKCQKQFENKDTIKKHIFAEHKEVAAYQCELCLNVFLTKKAYSCHLKLHKNSNNRVDKPRTDKNRRNRAKVPKMVRGVPATTNRQIQCELCPRKLSNNSSLRKHMKYHSGTNKSELCELCGRGFNDRTNLRIHVRTVHEKLRPYGCDICGMNFTAKKYVKAHILAHMYGPQITKPYQCDQCAKQYRWQKSLRHHQLRRHENKYPCIVCKLIFDSLQSYRDHKHFNTEIKFFCDICNKEFQSSYTLRRHVDAHNNVRRFPCDKCPLKFIDKAQLKRHMGRIHDPNHPDSQKVQCLVCKRRVKDIDKHMPTHANKKYCCTYCKSSFVEKRSLKRHTESMHLNLKHKCDVCNKSVISLRSLNRHKARVHKILKSERESERVREMDDHLSNESNGLHIELNPDVS